MRAVAFALAWGLALPAVANPVVYSWVDPKGVVHFTDDLGKVPEPYASMYQAQIRENERRRAEAAGGRNTPEPRRSRSLRRTMTIPDVTAPIEARRTYWQERVKTWRTNLANATTSLASLDQQLESLQLNPLLRTTPKVRQQIDAVQTRRKRALASVEAARKMLLDTIPKEARKQGVPPRWIL